MRADRTPWHRAGRRRVALVAALLALVSLLAGCAAIPTSGPIREGGEVAVEEPGQVFPLGLDPAADASPAEIVRGFLTASAAGVGDEFTVARRYLTRSARDTWDPRARLVILGGEVEVLPAPDDAEGTVRVRVPVAAVVDSAGRYTEEAPQSVEDLVFALRQDAEGQWRIADLENVILMTQPNFAVLYESRRVYFASADQQVLVPELRWFPTDKIVSYAVSALLQGPSPWLRDAVVSGAPQGADLTTSAVTVSDDRVATVELAGDVDRTAGADRNLLQAQLLATVGEEVDGVEVTVDGLPWEPTSRLEPVRDPAPTSGPYVLSGDRLAAVDNGKVVPLEDAAPLTGRDASDPALSPDTTIRVVLADGRTELVLLPADAGAPVTLRTGADLLAPSIDRHGWVWTGERVPGTQLQAVSADGAVVSVEVPWLEGRVVRSLRVARDGTRIAVVSTTTAGGELLVEVAGIVRDEDGSPRRLTEGMGVGAPLDTASQVVWVDEVTLGVLGRSGTTSVDTMHLVPVGGPVVPLALREGTLRIAAGRGDRALYLADERGQLLTRQNSSWRVLGDVPVRDPAFPG